MMSGAAFLYMRTAAASAVLPPPLRRFPGCCACTCQPSNIPYHYSRCSVSHGALHAAYRVRSQRGSVAAATVKAAVAVGVGLCLHFAQSALRCDHGMSPTEADRRRWAWKGMKQLG
jgi:hypothetical protein